MSVFELTVIFILTTLCWEPGWTEEVHPTPLWKSLLTYHPSWAGYMTDSTNRYISSFHTLSVQQDENGLAYVEFTSQHVSIEMTVTSSDNRLVIFKESTAWNKSAHYAGHTNLEFRGEFTWDQLYYKYVGNVSSTEDDNFATVMLLPEGTPLKRKNRKITSKVGLYVGIPIALGFIVITLGIMTMVWAFRRGYLRHVSWSYSWFRNSDESKSGTEMNADTSSTTTIQAVDQPAMHI